MCTCSPQNIPHRSHVVCSIDISSSVLCVHADTMYSLYHCTSGNCIYSPTLASMHHTMRSRIDISTSSSPNESLRHDVYHHHRNTPLSKHPATPSCIRGACTLVCIMHSLSLSLSPLCWGWNYIPRAELNDSLSRSAIGYGQFRPLRMQCTTTMRVCIVQSIAHCSTIHTDANAVAKGDGYLRCVAHVPSVCVLA